MSAPEPYYCDLRGLKCPLPVLRTRRLMKRLDKGALLRLETTDPLAALDIANLCREDGHDLLESDKTAFGHRFLIRRG